MVKFQFLQNPLDSSEYYSLEKLNRLIKDQLKQFFVSSDAVHTPQPQKCGERQTGSSVLSTVYLAVEIILCDLFFILLFPILLPLLGLNFFWRWTYNLHLIWSTNGRIRLMRGEDAFWASESPHNPGNFTSLYVIEGVPDLEKIRKRLNSSWVERKDKQGRPMFTKLKLRAVEVGGYFGWEYHTSFDLRQHVRHLHPHSPHSPISESQLFQEIHSIYDNILPGDKPQWEILLVSNYVYDDPALQGKHHYALLFRIHHSIMDGLSAAQALRLVVADNVVEAGVDPMKKLEGLSLSSRIVLYTFALFLTGPYLLRSWYEERESNPFHGPSLQGSKSLGWSRPLRLSAVRRLKSATSSSITALFISCIGGAFDSLARAKGLPAPKKLTAVTCAAFLPYPSLKPQNRFCVLFTPVASRASASSQGRAQGTAAAEVVMAYWITWIGGTLPITLLTLLQSWIAQGTVLLSNLPGPKTTTQIFGGDPIVDIVGWSPIRNKIGIAFCLFGYNGRIRANVVADSSAFPDPTDVGRFIGAFEREVAEVGRRRAGLREEDCFISAGASLEGDGDSCPGEDGFVNNLELRRKINKYTVL